MSYARVGPESDVYVIHHYAGKYVCYCSLDITDPAYPEDSFHEDRWPDGMIEHLEKHRARGDRVPEDALLRLRAERDSTEPAPCLKCGRLGTHRLSGIGGPDGVLCEEHKDDDLGGWTGQMRR